jgi:hypothetical protein
VVDKANADAGLERTSRLLSGERGLGELRAIAGPALEAKLDWKGGVDFSRGSTELRN